MKLSFASSPGLAFDPESTPTLPYGYEEPDSSPNVQVEALRRRILELEKELFEERESSYRFRSALLLIQEASKPFLDDDLEVDGAGPWCVVNDTLTRVLGGNGAT